MFKKIISLTILLVIHSACLASEAKTIPEFFDFEGIKNAPIFKVMQTPSNDGLLYTLWEDGLGRDVTLQNAYNIHIKRALRYWQEMDPFILKSMLIQESNMSKKARNCHGYAGIAQLGRHEARSAGLTVNYSIDERLIPHRAIEGCVQVAKIKAQALEKGVFKRYGRPKGDEYWKFIAAAYNAGEGTVSRAMRIAYGTSKPREVKFEDLITSASGNMYDTPLYKALSRRWHKKAKFREIKEFALHSVKRARQ